MILRDLNQDRVAVQRIADAVSAHNECQRLLEEEQAKKEEEDLEQLRRTRREEEEQAHKSKGKEKLEASSLPSPGPIPFPKVSPDHMDTEEELKLKQEQEEEERQEEVATLNSLVDHYKKEALEANALHREYETNYLVANAKLLQQQEIIVTLTHQGVEQLQEKEVKNLKEGLRYIRQETKELNEKYQ